jgi:uncharacterized protein YlxW (UPF0749 family)
MLALTVILAIFFVVYVLYLQSTVLMETRRHGRELQAQRELADKAEVSRFTELRSYLETRIASLQSALAARIEQSDNTTAAHVGQLEDRLSRVAGGSEPITLTPVISRDTGRQDPRDY